MPKGTRAGRAVMPTIFHGNDKKTEDELPYTVLSGGKKAKYIKGSAVRNIVGEEKANALKAATAASKKSRDFMGNGAKPEYDFTDKPNNPDKKARAKMAAKAKSTVDSEMDDVISMVKAKKTSKMSAYK